MLRGTPRNVREDRRPSAHDTRPLVSLQVLIPIFAGDPLRTRTHASSSPLIWTLTYFRQTRLCSLIHHAILDCVYEHALKEIPRLTE